MKVHKPNHYLFQGHFLKVLFSKLLHLPPLRNHSVGVVTLALTVRRILDAVHALRPARSEIVVKLDIYVT